MRRKNNLGANVKFSTVHAFQRMWKATQQPEPYDSLVDKHSNSYFSSPNVRKHITNLYRALEKENDGPKNREVRQNIKESRMQVRRSLGMHQNSDYLKVAPYEHGLKSSSKVKLRNFKTNFSENQKFRQMEHANFLKTHWNARKPQKPFIRMVRTLRSVKKLVSLSQTQQLHRRSPTEKVDITQN